MHKKISGEVIHGQKLGRKLGFPTANISYQVDDISDSVFLLNIVVDGVLYRGMGSHRIDKGIFEAHIFDFDRDIYGNIIEVILLKKIRDNMKFESLQELTSQIQKDQITCKKIRIPILTFGSFDVVHKGHRYYLFESKKYGTHLSTIVASDDSIKNIKKIQPSHNLKERIQAVKNLKISDDIIPGVTNNPMQWIEKISPSVICLGYDQKGPYVDKIQNEIDRLGLDTKVIRIESFYPEKFKSSIIKKKEA